MNNKIAEVQSNIQNLQKHVEKIAFKKSTCISAFDKASKETENKISECYDLIKELEEAQKQDSIDEHYEALISATHKKLQKKADKLGISFTMTIAIEGSDGIVMGQFEPTEKADETPMQ